MRHKLLIVALLICGYASAQPGYTKINSRYAWLAGRFDSGLHVTGFCGVPVTKAGVWNGDGQIGVDTCNNKFYFYSNNVWREAGGGSSTAYVDSVFINASNDSLIVLKAGNRYASLLPTGGSGSQNLQQVTNVGDTTTNSIRFGRLRQTYGTILNDNFTGAGFGAANYDTAFPNVTRTFTGSFVQIAGGVGNFNNYIEYNKPTGRNRWSGSVTFSPTTLSGTSYGVSLGTTSVNSFFATGFKIQFICDNSADKGKMRIWDNALGNIQTSTQSIAFNTNDSLRGSVSYNFGVVNATFYNITQHVTATFTYTFPTDSYASGYQAPNTGNFRLSFLGGGQNIYNLTIASDETVNNALGLGDSNIFGYTTDTTWTQRLFGSTRLYEKWGGPGDRSADAVKYLASIRGMQPSFVFLQLNTNDMQSGTGAVTYAANMRRISDSLAAMSFIQNVYYISGPPNNSNSIVPYNDSLSAIATRYGFTYINTYDSLKGSGTSWNANYTDDGIHFSDSGAIVQARIIARVAPELLGDNAIRFNRLRYDSTAIPVGFDNNGFLVATKQSSGGGGVTPDLTPYVQLDPSATQTGAEMDITGKGGTIDNIATFRSAATYGMIWVDNTAGNQSAIYLGNSGNKKIGFIRGYLTTSTADLAIYDVTRTKAPFYIGSNGDIGLGDAADATPHLKIIQSTGFAEWRYKFSKYNNTAPTDGKLLIGHTSNGTFELGNIASADGSVTVTNGAGGIDLSVPNNSIAAYFETNGATATLSPLVIYTTPNDGAVRVYDVSAMITVTAVSAGVLTTTLTYTDESNTSRTVSFFGMGATSAGLTTTGKSNFPVAGEIHAYPNTAISVAVTLTVGTATFNAGSTIRYIRTVAN